MSSMTEEEIVEYVRLQLFNPKANISNPRHCCNNSIECKCNGEYIRYWYVHIGNIKVFDFLNKHHFDYRGLIEKGLALNAPDGMYKFD